MPDPAAEGSRDAAIRDHLANERTLLAWQRTALTVIGLGFVVDRLVTEDAVGATSIGLILIALGGLVAVVGGWRYLVTERDIDRQSYRPSVASQVLLTAAIVVGAAVLAGYVILGR